jgi:predicted murein hydrolase (TIGR00659 family)
MSTLIHSDIFIMTLVLGAYAIGLWVQKVSKTKLMHPIITSIALIISVLLLLDIDYPTFQKGSAFINFLLGPAVVALGYALFENLSHVRGNKRAILTALVAGSLVGIISVVAICRLLQADETVIASLQPKSVTTPIALGLSIRSGGIPALTAIIVIASGIFGSVVGPWLLDKLGIKSRVARGLAMGAAAHGIGTARAMEMGSVEGAIGGMAIGLMGIITAILIPILEQFVW